MRMRYIQDMNRVPKPCRYLSHVNVDLRHQLSLRDQLSCAQDLVASESWGPPGCRTDGRVLQEEATCHRQHASDTWSCLPAHISLCAGLSYGDHSRFRDSLTFRSDSWCNAGRSEIHVLCAGSGWASKCVEAEPAQERHTLPGLVCLVEPHCLASAG